MASAEAILARGDLHPTARADVAHKLAGLAELGGVLPPLTALLAGGEREAALELVGKHTRDGRLSGLK